MPTIGTDCDITLTQATVNGGAPVGFLLRRPPRAEQLGGMLAITRRTAANGDGTFSDLVTFTMTILAATGMRNPNRTIHAASRAGAYASFLAFLAARTGITLTCAAGTFTNLQATQTPATEIHWTTVSMLTLTLNANVLSQYSTAADGTLSGASVVTVVPAPAAGLRRSVTNLTIHNGNAADVVLTVCYTHGASNRVIWTGTLNGGDTWSMGAEDLVLLDAADKSITAYLSAPLPAANPDYTATWRDTQ